MGRLGWLGVEIQKRKTITTTSPEACMYTSDRVEAMGPSAELDYSQCTVKSREIDLSIDTESF